LKYRKQTQIAYSSHLNQRIKNMLNIPNLANPELKFALQAVHQASSLVQQVQVELVSSALTKDDRSPVTVADFAAQALVGKLLDDYYPDDPMIGEEDSSILQAADKRETLEHITYFVSRYASIASQTSVCQWIDRGSTEFGSRFWTLDPIDGTKGFLRGDQYAVALAFVENRVVQIGVLGCPSLNTLIPDHQGSLVFAARGQGSWAIPLDVSLESILGGDIHFQQLKVSDCNDSNQARLLRSFESGHTNIGQIDYFAKAMGVHTEPVRMDSQAKYAVLAAGQGEIYLRLLSPKRIDYREKIWDQAAGSIVIEEAGGQVTDLDGKPLDFTKGRTLASNRGICATNGSLHEAALQALKTIGA
jgi:3'(2'), 5'-bisphosphate nucleotidase